jgi:hypothetical protein
MKKLLTLLAMLVCAFTATMAQTTYTYSLNGADDQSSPGYFSNVGKHSFNKFIVNSMRNIRGRHKKGSEYLLEQWKICTFGQN